MKITNHGSWLKLLFLPMVFWIIIVLGSLFWNVHQYHHSSLNLVTDRARAFFDIIEIQRLWNARHGGMYVPVTDENPPNPYLEDPLRDLTSTGGILLTKINPSYMTRQIAEIAEEEGNVSFHITSLLPIRPANRADTWEDEALREFEKGAREKLQLLETGSGEVYRYMAPLFVKEPCLKCHAEQGYKVGEIRGGISVSFPAAPFIEAHESHRQTLLLFHLGAFTVGAFLIAGILVERRKREETLRMLSVHDGLTGLANRRYFDEVFNIEWGRARRDKTPLSLIMIDIDFFKQYNDTYGHLAGDDCLKIISDTLKKSVMRPADFVARYGGEEFVILLPSVALENAVKLAETMRKRVQARKIPHDGSNIINYVTISAGVATAVPTTGLVPISLIEQADEAMYNAKQNGRNQVN